MTAKHQTPQYQRNARIVRARVAAAHRRGQAVQCWRCPRPIMPGMAYDVGHLPGATGSALHELAPEHRGENRREGGARGAHITNSRRNVVVPTGADVQTWAV